MAKRPTKSLCSKSALPASDYVINPYVGCTHRCRYCYARFMGRFTGHSEPWGTYLEPRAYASLALPRHLAGKTILIGSVTDPYQPAEARLLQMPPILKALRGCEGRVEILTKSALVVRDLALLQEIPEVAVGISLSNLSQADNDALEPGASSAAERLEALRTLHGAGISTYLFAAPYLPGVTNLTALAEAAKGAADYLCVENLNLRGGYKAEMLALMGRLHPELTGLYRSIYQEKGGTYWEEVEAEIQALGRTLDIPVRSYLHHEKIKKGAKKT